MEGMSGCERGAVWRPPRRSLYSKWSWTLVFPCPSYSRTRWKIQYPISTQRSWDNLELFLKRICRHISRDRPNSNCMTTAADIDEKADGNSTKSHVRRRLDWQDPAKIKSTMIERDPIKWMEKLIDDKENYGRSWDMIWTALLMKRVGAHQCP